MNRHAEANELMPSTRYRGSKRRIVSWLEDVFSRLEFNTVLDAMGGTGSVSYLLKKMGKEVTYNDALKFNYYIGKAIIENKRTRLSTDELDYLAEDSVDAGDCERHGYTIVQSLFDGIYYTRDENVWIDQVIKRIHGLSNSGYRGRLSHKQALAFYGLFQACLTKRPFNLFHRKNLSIRLRDVERSFGNKVTWEKNFSEVYRKFLQEANSLVFDSGKACRATNSSVFSIDSNFDLVYLDPPYVTDSGAESADYLGCYHFLEGLVNYKAWAELVDFSTLNRRFRRSYLDNEFTSADICQSLERLIQRFENSIIVISYKNGGVPSIARIRRMLSKYKRKVSIRSRHYSYALNHQNGNARLNREVLLIGE